MIVKSSSRTFRSSSVQVYLDRLGCSPPWFSGNYSKVCGRRLGEEEVSFLDDFIYRHLDMSEFSGCQRPCTRLDIQSRVLRYDIS